MSMNPMKQIQGMLGGTVGDLGKVLMRILEVQEEMLNELKSINGKLEDKDNKGIKDNVGNIPDIGSV